ncbi:MAG: cobalt ECF transporter T component CbiQ [Blautia sp.]
MSKINHAIYEIHHMDAMAQKDQWVNQIHPLVKLVLTIFYIVVTVSFSRYDIIGLGGMVVYPLAIFVLGDISIKDSLRRLRIVLPLVCVIGIFNPFFDKVPVVFMGIHMNAGVLSMLTLMIKGIFSVLASYLLIATTSIEKICYALSLLHVPKIIVTQILLTYRYITVLLEEVNRITQAYALRAPNQKGIHFKAWGSLTGQLLLRSMDRAEVVYESMLLRGYRGDFKYMGQKVKLRMQDFLYLLFWTGVILLFRMKPILIIIGDFAGGVFG